MAKKTATKTEDAPGATNPAAKNAGESGKKRGGVFPAIAGAMLAILFLGLIVVVGGIFLNFFELRTLTINYLEQKQPGGIVRTHISQERQAEIDEKNAKIDELNTQINDLKAQLDEKTLLLEAKEKENELLKGDLQTATSAKEAQESQRQNLVKVLDGMDAADTAALLESYNSDMAAELLKSMNPKRVSEIFTEMEPAKSAELLAKMQ